MTARQVSEINPNVR